MVSLVMEVLSMSQGHQKLKLRVQLSLETMQEYREAPYTAVVSKESRLVRTAA